MQRGQLFSLLTCSYADTSVLISNSKARKVAPTNVETIVVHAPQLWSDFQRLTNDKRERDPFCEGNATVKEWQSATDPEVLQFKHLLVLVWMLIRAHIVPTLGVATDFNFRVNKGSISPDHQTDHPAHAASKKLKARPSVCTFTPG